MEAVAEKYKMSDYGSIPIEWNVRKIQDLIDDGSILSHLDGNHGELYPRSSEFKDNGVPYIGANDFINGIVNFSSCKFLSEDRAKQFRKGVANDGDVLFAHNATVGPVAFLKTDLSFVILSTTATYFRCNLAKVNNIFLLYALQAPSFVKQYSAVMAQSTRFQVPIGAQRKLFFVLPTLIEQTAIATALSDADALISSLEKLIAKKRNIKQGAMQKLLEPNEGDGLSLSKGWVVKKLGEVCEIYRGGSPRPIESYLTLRPDGINWIKIGDVRKNAKYIESTEEKIIPDGLSRSRFVNKGDFILSNSMSFGRPYIMKINGCIHDGWLVIQNYQNHFDRDFLYYVLGSEAILQQYKSMASGSSVLNLNKEIVKSVIINCPKSVEEQARIAITFSDMDAEITALETKLEKYKKVKLGMMQNLLTGKIRLV